MSKGWVANYRVHNVTFENIRANGRYINHAAGGNFDIDPETTRNIRFNLTQSPSE